MSDPSRGANDAGLTHLDRRGRAQMVDVSEKAATRRVARARADFRLNPAVRELLLTGQLEKGEALAVARVAGIQAAKLTDRLIPLCHSLALSKVRVEFEPVDEDGIRVTTEAITTGPTGVEMEALTAASVAALTLYDMVKARCRGARIERVELVHKSGGKSGSWDAEGTADPAAPKTDGGNP